MYGEGGFVCVAFIGPTGSDLHNDYVTFAPHALVPLLFLLSSNNIALLVKKTSDTILFYVKITSAMIMIIQMFSSKKAHFILQFVTYFFVAHSCEQIEHLNI